MSTECAEIRACVNCGRELQTKKRKFCCDECRLEWKLNIAKVESEEKDMPSLSEGVCIYCGERIANGRRIFCSKRCSNKYHNARIGKIRREEEARRKEELSVLKSGASKGGRAVKLRKRDSLHAVAKRARENERSYGKETLQEALAVQSEQMARKREQLKRQFRMKQIEKEMAERS